MVTNPAGFIAYIECPDNIYFKDLGCPIPECDTGYYPRPYYCKFEDSRLEDSSLAIEKMPGEDMGVRLIIDENFEFTLGTTANVKVLDRFTQNPVPIKDSFKTSTFKSSGHFQRLLTNRAKQRKSFIKDEFTVHSAHKYPSNPYTSNIDHPDAH